MCVFVPLCEPLHSAELDVLTSRGSDKERATGRVSLTKKEPMINQKHILDIKRTHIPSHSYILCSFQTQYVPPLNHPFLHTSASQWEHLGQKVQYGLMLTCI